MALMRVTLAGGWLALLLLAAGCGGSAPAGGAAAVAPAEAVAYVWLDADRRSTQWRTALAVVDRIPGARPALETVIGRTLVAAGVTAGTELEAALGPEVAVAVLPRWRAVVLTRPRDPAALERLLGRLPAPAARAEIEGWTAVAERQADLDAFRQALARGRLDQDERFRALTGRLPAGALVRVFARGDVLADLPARAAGALPQLPGASGLASLPAGDVALALSSEADGLRISGAVRPARGEPGTTYVPTLLERVPAGASLAVSFSGSAALVARLRELAGGAGAAKQLEDLTGVPLVRVAQLFTGEGLLYARRAGVVPELTLALRPADPAAGAETLARLARSLAKRTGARVSTAMERGVEVTRIGSGGASLSLGRVGDLLVATTAPGGPASFGAGGDSLVNDPAFAAAAKRAGFEGRTSGLAYADPARLLSLVDATGNGGAAPAGLRRALGALGGIVLQTQAEGDGSATLTGFVRVPEAPPGP